MDPTGSQLSKLAETAILWKSLEFGILRPILLAISGKIRLLDKSKRLWFVERVKQNTRRQPHFFKFRVFEK